MVFSLHKLPLMLRGEGGEPRLKSASGMGLAKNSLGHLGSLFRAWIGLALAVSMPSAMVRSLRCVAIVINGVG